MGDWVDEWVFLGAWVGVGGGLKMSFEHTLPHTWTHAPKLVHTHTLTAWVLGVTRCRQLSMGVPGECLGEWGIMWVPGWV